MLSASYAKQWDCQVVLVQNTSLFQDGREMHARYDYQKRGNNVEISTKPVKPAWMHIASANEVWWSKRKHCCGLNQWEWCLAIRGNITIDWRSVVSGYKREHCYRLTNLCGVVWLAIHAHWIFVWVWCLILREKLSTEFVSMVSGSEGVVLVVVCIGWVGGYLSLDSRTL